MNPKDFVVFNAFASKPFGGNPAAVFPNASGIAEHELLPIARQLNLVETVFAYPSPRGGVDYKLRYFTPHEELPIAGHPTIATWAALATLGHIEVQRESVFMQESLAGTYQVRVSQAGLGYTVWMDQPEAKFIGELAETSLLLAATGVGPADLDAQLPVLGVDCGLGHLIIPVKSRHALLSARMDISALKALCDKVGVREAQLFTFETHALENDIYTRNFTPREGLEDPACGNGNAALGAYLARTKFKNEKSFKLRAEQGVTVQMPSLIEISVLNADTASPHVSIGGSAVYMLRGTIVA